MPAFSAATFTPPVTLDKPANDRDKPAYTFEGQFQNLSTPDVGALLGLRWAGGGFSGNGKIELSGYSASDLAASAKGDLHFEWRNGAMGNRGAHGQRHRRGPTHGCQGRDPEQMAIADAARVKIKKMNY